MYLYFYLTLVGKSLTMVKNKHKWEKDMARLPQPGGDSGNWGDILNEYLLVEHDGQGHLKPGVVGTSQIAANAVTAIHVADNILPQAKIQNLSIDLAAKYQKPADGIAKSDLSASVQASLDKADTALQSAPPAGAGATSLSGFPLRLTGERIYSYPTELGRAHTASMNPSGAKKVVLAELWGKAGVLKHIWMATSDGDAGAQSIGENGGIVRIFIDDQTTPVVQLSINDFFAYALLAGEYSTRRIGRTKRGNGESSAYRYLHMPFQKYLRVEVENTSSNDAIVFGSADYSVVGDFSLLGSQQLSYKMHSIERPAAAPYDQLTVVDTAGSGQLESLWLSVVGADEDIGVLEGNIEIYIDGELYPSWQSSGTEDAFNGGWYNVPIGGYPAGRAGNSINGGLTATYYRFFTEDPLFFSSHIKIVVNAGQRNQGAFASSTVSLSAFAGLWANTPGAINFQTVDTGATAILDDQFTGASGSLSAADWNQVGDRTQAEATGSTIRFAFDGGSAGQDTRAARKNVTLPGSYWLETRVRITDATHDGQEASLIVKGNSPDPYFGSAVHIQLVRFSQNNWVVRARDDFDEVFIRTIGGGRNLTNEWVKLAVKVVSQTMTAYWMPEGCDSWQTLGSWTTGKTGEAFGIGTWTAGAEFDYLVVRSLTTVAS